MPEKIDRRGGKRPVKRNWIDTIHKWAGLIVWPFLVLQAITGALIVDNERTSQFFDSQMFVATPRTGEIDPAVVDQALPKLRPGEAYASVIFPIKDDFPVLAIKVPSTPGIPTMIAIDPANRKILGQKPVLAVPNVVANLWHESLFAGTVGKIILMIIGTAFAAMIVTGLIRWWPKGDKGKALRIRWAGTVGRTMWQAHAPIGVIFSAVFLWLTVTGTLVVANVIGEAAPIPAGNGTTASSSITELANVTSTAQKALPYARLVAIQPVSKLAPVHTLVFVDPQWRQERVVVSKDGLIKAVHPADNVLDWMLPLHRGSMLPEPVRALWYLFALALIGVAISGFVINRSKAGLKRKRS